MGTFDILHSGHLFLFGQCRKIAGDSGKVVVSVNSDTFVSTYKGSKPAQTLEDRFSILENIRNIDSVTVLSSKEQTKSVILQVLGNRQNQNFLVVGDDWAPPKDYYEQLGVDQTWLDDHDISLIYIPRSSLSSTSIKTRIRESDTKNTIK
jgi:cytidyltransferase-like protein